jgi:heme-degrading monooxygenase HmoA
MYGVVAVFTLDRAWDEEHRRTVEEQLIPTTRQVPGFVSGYWMSDPAQPRSHVLTIWETEEMARAFIEFVQGRRAQAEQEAGVSYDSMTLVEVIGEAHR